MKRKEKIELITKKLTNKSLMWVGNRSSDLECLSDFDALNRIVSTIAPINNEQENNLEEYCLETTSLKRVDLNSYHIDYDSSSELHDIYNKLLNNIKSSTIIIPYAPSKFLTSLFFSKRPNIENWAMFFLKQHSYTYKPWVESELSNKHEVNIIPWEYFNDGNIMDFQKKFSKNEPTILRVSQGSGGAGMIFSHNPEDAIKFCSNNHDGFFSASKYISESFSISINAVLYRNGQVRIFHPSMQLIGIKETTTRDLGFCGSDYSVVKTIEDSLWDKSEDIINKIGEWLKHTGYLGVFGVDLLFHNDDVYFVELNPRFTASSISSSKISKHLEQSDVFLEHISAYCRLDCMDLIPLKIQVKEQKDISELIVYNTTDVNLKRMGNFESKNKDYTISELPNKNVNVEPNAQLFKISFNRSITDNGKQLHKDISDLVKKNIKLWKTGKI